jgi:response regulator of citrate/malate metabolism
VIRTLIVDDDFMVAKVHAGFVADAGFVAALDGFEVVGTASTGTDALAAVPRLRPDLVLLDVNLPDMTGLQVLRRLRRTAHRSTSSSSAPLGTSRASAARCTAASCTTW